MVRLKYSHIVEIGAGDSYSSRCLSMSTHAERVELFEPNRVLFDDLRRFSQGLENVRVFNAAISKASKMYHLGYASFMEDSRSFLGDMLEPEGFPFLSPLLLEVPQMTMSAIDDGTIDLLVLTTNGGESKILKEMVSRPKVIYTKHYCHAEKHWEDANQTIAWLVGAGYQSFLLDTNQHRTYHSLEWRRL